MEKAVSVAQVILPIFVTAFLGMYARKKNILTPEGVQGLQKFAMNIGLPCVLFNSLLTAKVGPESIGIMALLLPCMLASAIWAFRVRKNRYPYHNLPMLFGAQGGATLGIPLFMILFGSAQAYHMAILDLTQAIIAHPIIAILNSDTGDHPKVSQVLKRIFSSPLVIMCLAGLALNITGIGAWLDTVGVGGVITEVTSFLGQPVSAILIFSIGYNFSLSGESRRDIFRLSAIHFVLYALIGIFLQLAIFLLPNVTSLTRWAVLLFSFLPSSYLAPSLGRTPTDNTVASGMCSLLTIPCVIVFCIIAACIA